MHLLFEYLVNLRNKVTFIVQLRSKGRELVPEDRYFANQTCLFFLVDGQRLSDLG